jgi:hypothetical protein
VIIKGLAGLFGYGGTSTKKNNLPEESDSFKGFSFTKEEINSDSIDRTTFSS